MIGILLLLIAMGFSFNIGMRVGVHAMQREIMKVFGEDD